MEDESRMQTRALVAMVLALVVIMGYQFLFPPPPPKKQPRPAVTEKQKEVPSQAEREVSSPEVLPEASGARESEILIDVETPLYHAKISTLGATVKMWKLKEFKDDEGREIVLAREDARIPPLSIGFGPEVSFRPLQFSVAGDIRQISITSPDQTRELRLVYRDQKGVVIERIFQFRGDDYRVDITERVQGPNDYWVTLGSGFGITGTKGYRSHSGPVILKEADRKEFRADKLKKTEIFTEGLKWVAQEDKYFFAGLVPLGVKATGKVWRAPSGEVLTGINLPQGENRILLYAGPKEHERLKQYGVELEYIIDFGFFSILARPLFWILKFLYRYIGNYGWAIILLTIIVRVPFIPIMNRGQKSMKKLQALQPKMNEIRQKYKKDPQKMQKEMMELYKKYKVNPMSGCLPLLIQIPVFFALYKVLLIAIELRGAPFMFWIQDLSEKDPYYILPIVMGITMFIQQKMTPTGAGNPQQQKVMQFMPIIFTFLFLSFPSGLVLYWLVSNLLSIIQQYYVNKKLAKEVAEQGLS